MGYLALSHCWGMQNSFQLFRSNLNQLTKGFEIARLPETFQDAIMICRRLKQRFIWIDSLCIVQDGDDWATEASQMARVYGNSICTIAALSSDSDHGGCFSARNNLGHCTLVFSDNSGRPFMVPECGGSGATRNHHLHTRGWVFQERLLSPRTLGFSSTGIYWECGYSLAHEEHPGAFPLRLMSSTDVKLKDMFRQATTPLLQPLVTDKDRKVFLVAWYELVHNYSKLAFTRQEDRLVAIAGIAQTIHKSTGFEYFYGIWLGS
ncbi:uncharacterized protein K452DRAFT_232035, partial [Aplosporella prunicola CBS 121167]